MSSEQTVVATVLTESGLTEKRRLAPAFDRLVESNLELTTSVSRLVRVSYLLLVFYAIGHAASVIVSCHS